MSNNLDWLNDQPNAELTIKNRVELKDLVAVGESKLFMFGLGQNDVAYNAGGEYTGEDSREITAATLWLHVEDAVSGDFAEGQNMFSKMWLSTGPNDPIFDLGYLPNKRAANEALDAGSISVKSWQRVYPHLSKVFTTTITQPVGYHYVPLIEVEEIREGKKVTGYKPVAKIMVKMNGPKRRDGQLIGQFGALVDALSGFTDGGVYGRVFKLRCTGEPSNYYVYTPVMTNPINTPELDGYIEEMVDANVDFWTNSIFAVNNMGGFDPENVRKYLLSITRFDTWEEFVARYDIRADVKSTKNLKKVQTVKAGEMPDDVAM